MMDRNERLTYLNTRSTNESAKRVISQVLADYINIRAGKAEINQSFYQERITAIKNALFLKYTGIEFESVFQSIYLDKKFTVGA